MIFIPIAMALMLIPNVQASMGLPNYDSGWVSINQGQTLTLTHNLDTTELLIYVVGKGGGAEINQQQYGGDINQLGQGGGLYWKNLNNTAIKVTRYSDDGVYPQVRVQIWKIEAQGGGVGGYSIPIDKLELLTPYIALAVVLVAIIALSAYTWKHWTEKTTIQRTKTTQTT